MSEGQGGMQPTATPLPDDPLVMLIRGARLTVVAKPAARKPYPFIKSIAKPLER